MSPFSRPFPDITIRARTGNHYQMQPKTSQHHYINLNAKSQEIMLDFPSDELKGSNMQLVNKQ